MAYETEITAKQLYKALKKLKKEGKLKKHMPVVRFIGMDGYDRPMFRPITGVVVIEGVWFDKGERDVLEIG